MYVSLDWLQSLDTTFEFDAEVLASRLMLSGLEIESITNAGPELEGVIVGHVESCEQHPNADRLRVCLVNIGSAEPLQIVCGAPNVHAGALVPVIQVGATLPCGTAIKACQLRGVDSAGMICSAKELSLGEGHDGILLLPSDAPVGQPFAEYLRCADQIFELAITPNRGDCLSMQGVLREARALLGQSYQAVSTDSVTPTHAEAVATTLQSSACSHYSSRVIRGIDASATIPLWMSERLRRANCHVVGHAVVDILNYVMLETGQPMHAFDMALCQLPLSVRQAQSGESLDLLDGSSIQLHTDDMVIADTSGAVALAGIMGGQSTAVSANTTDIILESAYFDAAAIGVSARRHRLSTDSSYRFERGVDWQKQQAAIERATALLQQIVSGEPGPVTTIQGEQHPTAREVSLHADAITRCLGFVVPADNVTAILQRLGCQVNHTDDHWQVTVPSYRPDISLDVDLIEEIARVYGYDRIPAQPLVATLTMSTPQAHTIAIDKVNAIKHQLVARGFQEVINYSFVSPTIEAILGDTDVAPALPLSNPLSQDMSVMRRSLWGGLLQTYQHNLKRQHHRQRLFEWGVCFLPRSGDISSCEQVDRVAGLVAGRRYDEAWAHDAAQHDFYDLKQDVLALLTARGIRASFRTANHAALHPHQQAAIHLPSGQVIGYIGVLHPAHAAQLKLKGSPILFEVNTQPLMAVPECRYQPVSKFPMVRRDISLVMPEKQSVQAVQELLCTTLGEKLVKSTVFDVYSGDDLPNKQKSVSFALFFQEASRTLVDAEVDSLMHTLVQALADQLDIHRREQADEHTNQGRNR